MKQTTWEFRNIEKFPLPCLILVTFSSQKTIFFLFIRKCSHLLLFTRIRITIYYKDCLLFLIFTHVLLKSLILKNNISREQKSCFQELLKYYIFKEIYIIQEVLK